MRRVLPFDSGDATQVDPSWPLAPGLVFAASLADGQGGNASPVGGAKNLLTGVGTSSGLIHSTSTPFGKGRRRTDGSSNFIWDYRERVDVGTGDFTAAVYGLPTVDGASVLNWFSNDTGVNQWRILTDCNTSIGFAAGSLAFWTFDGATTITAAAGAMIDRPAWYIGIRRGSALEIWRNGTLLATSSGTVRNVTGTKQGKIMLGSGTTNSRGLFGPALLWRRALTPTEVQSLNPDAPFDFVKSPYRHAIVPAQAGSTQALDGVVAATNAGTVGVGVSKALTGVSATAAAGTLAASAAASVALTGVSSTAAAGSVSAGGDATAAITGAAAAAAQGSVGLSVGGSAALTGISATATTGSVAASSGAVQALTGISASIAQGTVGLSASGSVALTGVSTTVFAGTLGILGFNDVTVFLTGTDILTTAGQFTTHAYVGGWVPVDDSAPNGWVPVDDSNVTVWS